MNRKVLHLINGEHYSGAERVQDLLVQHLGEYGIDAWLGCVKPDKFRERCHCDVSRVLDFPMSSRFDLLQAYRIGRYLSTHGCEVIHSHTPRTALLAYIASKVARVPIVHHLHSPTARDTENSRRNRINTVIENFVMNRADHVIAVSSSLKNYLLDEGVKEEKISVVLNGVPSVPVLPERETPDGEYVLGMVALFRPRKGLEVILKAVSVLKSNGIMVRLSAIGPFETDDYRQQIFSLVQELDITEQIDWVGFVSDVYTELKKLDIFVLPSLYGEGLPMVVLESMANGVPVISSNIEGLPDAIPDDEHGLLVEPGDEKALAAKIQQLTECPALWRTIRGNAYQRQVRALSAQMMAKGVADVYKRVV